MKEHFYNRYKDEDNFFVEGPIDKPNIKNAINKIGIDTKEIDSFRQGIEITQIKHFSRAACSPGSGEPGHLMSKLNFGSDRRNNGKSQFIDQVKFNPVKYIESLPTIYTQITNPVNYVIDNDITDNVAYDGAIEPLTIRAKSTFYSIDFPFESHDIRGGFMGGTMDQSNSSCQILTVDYRRINNDFVPYLDSTDISINGNPSSGYFIYDKTEILPFSDTNRIKSTFIDSTKYGDDMYGEIIKMNPSTENYVSYNQVSSTSGWDYENNSVVGTDSIAFGGMTYL